MTKSTKTAKTTNKTATPATPATPAKPTTFNFAHASLPKAVSLNVYEGTIDARLVNASIGCLDAPEVTTDEITETVRGVETTFSVVKPSELAMWLESNKSAGVKGATTALAGILTKSATTKGDRTAQLSASVKRTHRDLLVKRLRKAGMPIATRDNGMPYLALEMADAATFKESGRRERQGQGLLMRVAVSVASGQIALPETTEVVGLDYTDLLALWGE